LLPRFWGLTRGPCQKFARLCRIGAHALVLGAQCREAARARTLAGLVQVAAYRPLSPPRAFRVL